MGTINVGDSFQRGARAVRSAVLFPEGICRFVGGRTEEIPLERVDRARSLIDPQGVRIFNYCAVPPKRAMC